MKEIQFVDWDAVKVEQMKKQFRLLSKLCQGKDLLETIIETHDDYTNECYSREITRHNTITTEMIDMKQ